MSDTTTAPPVRREPALIVGIVVGVISGSSTFLAAWGAGQDVRVAAAAGLGVLATSITGAAVVRSQVSPAYKVDEAAEQAYRDVHAADHPGNPFGTPWGSGR